MKPFFISAFAIVMISGTLGCSMCCGPYDFNYPTYGGKYERVDPAYGRVGSVFSDPNAGFNGDSSDSVRNEPLSNRLPQEGDSKSTNDDGEIERFKRELESENLKRRETEELPPPDTDPTASRIWRNRAPRNQWR